jgi:hypothetical protein
MRLRKKYEVVGIVLLDPNLSCYLCVNRGKEQDTEECKDDQINQADLGRCFSDNW